MNSGSRRASWGRRPWHGWLWFLPLWMVATVGAQTCQSAADMDAFVRTALETTAKRYFDMASRGDSAGLQQNSIPAVAASFGGIEAAVKDNQQAFAGAQVTVRPPFFLVADGTEPLARAEFLCGVFGRFGQTSNSAVFVLNNLPPGKYSVAVVDAKGSQDARTLTLILQQVGTDWKLAGFYVRSSQVNGHDGGWFAQHAREFKAKGQNRNAWLYYREAIALTAPADFMSTLSTDKFYDEAQAVQPSDLPSPDHPLVVVGHISPADQYVIEHQQKQTEQFSVAKAGKSYSITQMFPLAVGNDLHVVVKYQVADVSNTVQAFQDNMAVIRGLVAKFPEFRDAFDGVVARAVEPSGRDYGSMLPMKEIK
ncbi:MAG: hypothetical protein WAQ52_17275 [Terriglobales bacterium]